MRKPLTFWVAWLLSTSAGVVLFGLALVLAPALTLQGFSLLVYSDSQRIATFGQAAVHYVSLVHAVIGGVMAGWGVALVLVVRGPFASGAPIGWQVIAASLVAWFVTDPTYSLWSGFWQNAVLNAERARLGNQLIARPSEWSDGESRLPPGSPSRTRGSGEVVPKQIVRSDGRLP